MFNKLASKFLCQQVKLQQAYLTFKKFCYSSLTVLNHLNLYQQYFIQPHNNHLPLIAIMQKPFYNYNYSPHVQKPSSVRGAPPLFQPSSVYTTGHPQQQQKPQRPFSSKASYTSQKSGQFSSSSFTISKTQQNQQLSNFANMRQFEEMSQPIHSPKSMDGWFNRNIQGNNSNSNNNSRQMFNNQRRQPVSGHKLIAYSNDPIDSYIEWLQQSFMQFQRTGNVKLLKRINQQNSLQILKLFQQLSALKQTSPLTTNNNIRQLSPYSRQNSTKQKQSPSLSKPAIQQELRRMEEEHSTILKSIASEQLLYESLSGELQQEIHIKENRNLNQSQIREENHLKQMQETIQEMQDEIKDLERKNADLAKAFDALPFFREWNVMFEEAKGATKLGIRLGNQCDKREELIREIGKKGESDQGDSSVRKINEEGNNKERPSSSFKKPMKAQQVSKPPTLSPTSLLPPASSASPKPALQCSVTQKPQSSRTPSSVIIRHLSHSNRFSQSKKPSSHNSIDKPSNLRKQSYDKITALNDPPSLYSTQWKTQNMFRMDNVGT